MIANYFNITKIEESIISMCYDIWFYKHFNLPESVSWLKTKFTSKHFEFLEVPNAPGLLSITAEAGCISVSVDSSYQLKTTFRVS